jgi:D-glycero-D-manno-heptose 1,7-bisphosphate phosphatase
VDAPPLEDDPGQARRAGADVRRAVLLDRDGTVCEEVGYIDDIDRVRLIDGSAEAIRMANRAELQTVIVTNQAGVARGLLTEDLVGETHDRIRELLAEADARLDGIYYCPHHPDVGGERYRKACDCRKPAAGMLLRARDEMGIDLESSYVVGDSIRDVEAGGRVGATTVLVLTGHGKGQLAQQSDDRRLRPDHIATDLREAMEWILQRESRAGSCPALVNRT